MKTAIKTFALALSAMVATFVFSSFTATRGGEGFEVYLNSKLVLQQYGEKMHEIKSLQLNPQSANDELSVRYHHCGKAGRNRVIAIKDASNKTLKEFRFEDSKEVAAPMRCKVKDIIGVQKSGPVKLQLFYTSSELPKGRQLASLIIGENANAKAK